MANPQLSQVYVDKAIANAAIGYKNAMYIADQVAPRVDVRQRTGDYFVFDSDGASVTDAASVNRSPGTDAPRGGYKISTEKFACKDMAFAHPVPDEIVEQADEAIRPLERGIRFCLEKCWIRRERFAAEQLFVASTWGTATDWSGTAWSDFANSDPASDINTGKSTVKKLCGYDPNTLVMGQEVYDKIVLHPDAIDRIKYTQTGILTPELVGKWLGIDRVIVGGASYNAAAEGATLDRQFIWGKNALLLYVPSSPSIDEPAAAYMFQMPDAETRSWREESPKQTVVEAKIFCDIKRTATRVGYYLPSVVA